MLLMDRSGFVEETAFTYSYGPLRDEAGTVHGVIDIAYETTPQIIDRRRLATVSGLSAALQGLAGPTEVGRVGLDRLAAAADIRRAELHLGAGDELTPVGSAGPGAGAGALGALADAGTLRSVAQSGRATVIGSRTVVAPLAAHRETATVGVIALEGKPRRPFDAEHRASCSW